MNVKVLCFVGLALLGVAAALPANKVSESVDVTGRAVSEDFLDTIQEYFQGQDLTFNLPVAGAKITVSPRNLGNEELNVNVKFSDESRGSGAEPRKSKLKKIIGPILVFVLLKALILVPVVLGVLGLKAWNVLQVSFFSFIVSFALAIFQLCKKIAVDNSPPPITHGGWEAASAYRARSMDETNTDAQNLAFSAYA